MLFTSSREETLFLVSTTYSKMGAPQVSERAATSCTASNNDGYLFSFVQTRALLGWLRTVPPTADNLANVTDNVRLEASAFSHGQSNPTYLVTVVTPKMTQRFILRSKPAGNLLPGAHRIDREYKVLSALIKTPVPTPVPYAYCTDRSILGVEFYTMSYASGTIFKDVSLTSLSDPADRTQVFMEALRILWTIRSLDVSQLGLATLSRPLPSWLDRQIDTWFRQFRASHLDDVDYSAMEVLSKRLKKLRLLEYQKEEVRCLVHGDFRVDNLVFNRRDGQLVCTAVLDWELVSLGSPLADLASLVTPYYLPPFSESVSVLRSMTFVHPRPPGILPIEVLIKRYVGQNCDAGTETRKYLKLYVAVALFKFAAIMYGVLYRSRHRNAASPHASALGSCAYVFAEAGLELLDGLDKDLSGAPLQAPKRTRVDTLTSFVNQEVLPLEQNFIKHAQSDNRWSVWSPIEMLKSKAKNAGLWNLFLPKAMGGELTCEEYGPLAEYMGRCVYAAEVFNCSAPDTGNMELLARYGTPAQKERWLKPLLAGDIRSCFGMTEPNVASSDALNLSTRIDKDDEKYVVNGRKWWTSGAMDPRCKVMLLLGRGPQNLENVNRDCAHMRHRQHTVVLIPMGSDGVQVERYLTVFGYDDAPHGHAEISLSNVVLNASDALLHVEGGGFEAAQSRLGGGRLHHCMRLVGLAERAQELLVARANMRETFGKKLIQNDAVIQVVGQNRCDIDTMRAVVRSTSRIVDAGDVKEIRRSVGVAKVVVPRLACRVVDRAIQVHGGLGVCQDTLLGMLYAHARSLQIADGPDEVHLHSVAKGDIKSWQQRARL